MPEARSQPETRLISYLLGELSEAEEAQLEQQYLQDEALHQQLLLAEDELVESYLRGELAREQCHRFESHFLASPARRKRLESTRVMMRAIDAEAAVPSSSPKAAVLHAKGIFPWLLAVRVPVGGLAAAVLLLGAGLAFLALRLQTAQQQLEEDRAVWSRQEEDLKRQLAQRSSVPPAGTAKQSSETPQPLPAPTNPASRGLLASVVLTPGLSRDGGELPRISLSPESPLLCLHLVLPDTATARHYRATIKTVDGDLLWSQAN
ncbi:MAG: hypothetical protein ACREB3_00080, partial [Burkholderiales bacterium]